MKMKTNMKTNMNLNTARYTIAALLFVMIGLQAAADVNLNTSVQKVQAYLTEDGQRKTRLVPAEEIVPGDELRYVIEYSNVGDLPVDQGSIVITDPIPNDTIYVTGTAFGSGTEISFSVDEGGEFSAEQDLRIEKNGVDTLANPEDYTTIRWKFGPVLEPGQKGHVSFNVVLK